MSECCDSDITCVIEEPSLNVQVVEETISVALVEETLVFPDGEDDVTVVVEEETLVFVFEASTLVTTVWPFGSLPIRVDPVLPSVRTQIDTVPIAAYKTIKYFLSISDEVNDFTVSSEILATRKNNDTYLVEYALIGDTIEIPFTTESELESNQLKLFITHFHATNCVVRLTRLGIFT